MPATARPAGGDVLWFGVALSTTADPTTAATVARIKNYPANSEIPITLPASVSLTRNEHFQLLKVVDDIDDLPSAPDAIDGQLRGVAATGDIFIYDDALLEWANYFPLGFSPYVSSGQSLYGADLNLSSVSERAIFYPVDYYPSGSGATGEDAPLSQAVVLWLVNDTTVTVPIGSQVWAYIEANGIDVSSYAGLVSFEFIGHVNSVTGELDTDGLSVGGSVPFQGNGATNLRLQKELLPNYAWAVKVRCKFSQFQVGNFMLSGTELSVSLEIQTNQAEYTEGLYSLTGPAILPEGERRVIVPSGYGLVPHALPGAGVVWYHTFNDPGYDLVTGLAANTADQLVAISPNGNCYVVLAVAEDMALRAKVGTVDGPGLASPWSDPVTVAADGAITITATVPTAIRDNYPDSIAGYETEPNALQVIVYVRHVGSGVIESYTRLLSAEPVQVELLAGDGDPVAAMPSPAADFGLFEFDKPTAVAATGGSLAAGDYEVAIGFSYSGTVTSISHSTTEGCISTIERSLARMAQKLPGWSSLPTGDLSRATFDTSTVTTEQLAQVVAALLTDLRARGDL